MRTPLLLSLSTVAPCASGTFFATILKFAHETQPHLKRLGHYYFIVEVEMDNSELEQWRENLKLCSVMLRPRLRRGLQ